MMAVRGRSCKEKQKELEISLLSHPQISPLFLDVVEHTIPSYMSEKPSKEKKEKTKGMISASTTLPHFSSWRPKVTVRNKVTKPQQIALQQGEERGEIWVREKGGGQ